MQHPQSIVKKWYKLSKSLAIWFPCLQSIIMESLDIQKWEIKRLIKKDFSLETAQTLNFPSSPYLMRCCYCCCFHESNDFFSFKKMAKITVEIFFIKIHQAYRELNHYSNRKLWIEVSFESHKIVQDSKGL